MSCRADTVLLLLGSSLCSPQHTSRQRPLVPHRRPPALVAPSSPSKPSVRLKTKMEPQWAVAFFDDAQTLRGQRESMTIVVDFTLIEPHYYDASLASLPLLVGGYTVDIVNDGGGVIGWKQRFYRRGWCPIFCCHFRRGCHVVDASLLLLYAGNGRVFIPLPPLAGKSITTDTGGEKWKRGYRASGRGVYSSSVIPSKAWTQPNGTELYGWVASEVLGTQFKVTKEYLDYMLKDNIVFAPNHCTKYKLEVPDVNERICFLNHRAGDVPSWLWVYDCLFTKVGIHMPLTSFQQEILWKGAITPSQLHPNSWAFIRSFELVYQALGEFLSLRAHGKMKIFELFDEFFFSFKDIYFKISGAPKTQHFFLTSEKKARFDLYWRMGYRLLRPGANELFSHPGVDMAGGMSTLVALRRRIIAKQQNQYLMTSETEEALGDLEVDDRLAGRGGKTLSKKAKKLEDEKQAAEKRASELMASKKRVTELEASLRKAREDLVSIENLKEDVEASAMTMVTEIEENMLG
ncbi:hypothetical protein PIB30_060987 [Stylosanthes scabra]|uniref:Uncharacterized protein n=1 Tax=Stylosanthes scabra TaxID=79078 RepID=A0ABU6WJ78_9FABA|nr:hypothetical protein [Stylosanthes scabra]